MFSDKLRHLRETDGISQINFSKQIGFSQAAISAWENNTREPGIEALLRIARFFNVTVDYLVGNHPAVSVKADRSPQTPPPEETHLLETFRKLNTKNRMHVVAYAEIRLEEQGPAGAVARNR